jgi:predicted AlkP superfamily phosphohydrolase/phosphomutase
MPPLARLLFIGIDSGDKDVILQLAASGDLPVLASLLQTSAVAPTRNPLGLYVGAVWPSFYTGLSPANHGRYCFEQLGLGSYRVQRVRPEQVRGEPFWCALSRAGKRVAVIDVPKCAPARELNGIHVVDWGSHDPEEEGLRTWPPALARELVARFGGDPVGNCNGERSDASDYLKLRDALVARAEAKAALSAHFLEQGGWDAFFTTFAESHCVGHQCWNLRDPAHPRHDARVAAAVGDPIRDVYRAIDAGIGTLLARAGDDTTAIVLASHGIGPHYDASFLLDEILRRLEMDPARRRVRSLARTAWQKLPKRWRGRMKRASARAGRPVERRRFFRMPNNDVYGAIRINVAGREPAGIVAPGRELDAVFEQLEQALLAFRIVDTGAPLVSRVIRTREVYAGESVDELPDLLVEWNRERPISAVTSPRTGTVRGSYEKCRTGDHRPEGLLLARGPGIRAARLAEPIAVEDFAPSFAELCGVELARSDGRSFVSRLRAS